MLDFAPAVYQYSGMFVLCLLLLRLPATSKFFRVLNTMFHEDGHAVVALLTSAKVERIDLFADTSGACVYRPKNWFSAFLVNLAGYPFSSLSAAFMFYLLHHGKTDWFLYGLSGILLLNLLLWVRNGYGILWLFLFGLFCAACFYFKIPALTFYFLLFISTLNLTESVYSTLVILYLSAENPSSSGDAYALREQTLIPAVVWALLFTSFAALVAIYVIEMLFGLEIISYV